MDYIKLQRMKKIISSNETKIACVGTKICELDELEVIVNAISSKYQYKDFSEEDIRKISNYIMKKYNHNIVNSKMIVNSFLEAINLPNIETNKSSLKNI